MTHASSRWALLRKEIDGARSADSAHVKNELLRQLNGLAERGHCSRNVQGWLHLERNKKQRRKELLVKPGDARDNWRHPSIRLKNLAGLEDGAVLGLMVTLGDHDEKILAYTVSLQGNQRPSGLPWYARIDLDDEPKGKGLCGHPILHCHVGVDPGGEEPERSPGDEPASTVAESTEAEARHKAWSPRVPLPWLFPWEALQWLLATADPSLEPATAPPPSG